MLWVGVGGHRSLLMGNSKIALRWCRWLLQERFTFMFTFLDWTLIFQCCVAPKTDTKKICVSKGGFTVSLTWFCGLHILEAHQFLPRIF